MSSRLDNITSWFKVRITFIADVLATNSADKTLHDTYIASKAPDDDERKLELDSLPKVEEMGTTVFLRDPKTQQFWMGNHMLKGFFKASGEVFRMTESPEEEPEAETEAAKEDIKKAAKKLEAEGKKPKKAPKTWGNIKTKINNMVQVYPKQLFLNKIDGTPITAADMVLQRSLRAETQQGPRVALAKSESVMMGSYLDATVVLVGNKPVTQQMLLDCLEYGKIHGLGQWRNAGFGAFVFEILEKGEGLPDIMDERIKKLREMQAAIATKKA